LTRGRLFLFSVGGMSSVDIGLDGLSGLIWGGGGGGGLAFLGVLGRSGFVYEWEKGALEWE